MAKQLNGMQYDDELLGQIEKGMEVVDNQGEALGKVTLIQFPTGDIPDERTPEAGEHGQPLPSFSDAVPELARVTTPPPPQSENFRERMQQSGYVKVRPGLLQADWYVTPDQVAAVHQDTVQLNVGQDALIRA